MPNMTRAGSSSDNLSELVYQQIKNDIFDFKLMPGERFTESEIALNYQVSRTPTRQALYRLQQDHSSTLRQAELTRYSSISLPKHSI